MLEKMFQNGTQWIFAKDQKKDGVQYLQPFNARWLPEGHNVAYSKLTCWQEFKQFKLMKVEVSMCDFKFKTVYNTKKNTQIEDKKVVTFQYKWFQDDENNLKVPGTLAMNSNKLNRTNRVASESLKPTWKYVFKPTYDTAEGWVNVEDTKGYGNYATMYNSWNFANPADQQKSGFATFLEATGAQNYFNQAINLNQQKAPDLKKLRKLPRLMYCKRREYAEGIWKAATNIESLVYDMTYNIKIKTFWEFKG